MRLNPRKSLAMCSVVGMLAIPAPSRMSDPVGCYAIVDRVVIDDDGEDTPTIQIWGVFALSDGNHGNGYSRAERGYLHYTMNRNEKQTRAEWQDLKAMAGTGRFIGFGGRYEAMGRVRPAHETTAKPDVYPSLSWAGIVKGRPFGLSNAIIADLYAVPAPVSPHEGARVAAGPVTLTAKPVADTTLQMVFLIEGPSRIVESSGPLRVHRANLSWSPKMQLNPGDTYTWRVYSKMSDGSYTSSAAVSTFRVVK